MKKTILTVLALAATLSLIPPVANAAKNQDTQSNSMNVAASSAVPTALSEIKGTIESIKHHGITVKDKDGGLYVIPIWEFEKTENFKQLNLQEGTTITAKGYIQKKPGTFTITLGDTYKVPLPTPQSQDGEAKTGVFRIDLNNDSIIVSDINSTSFIANEISTDKNTIKLAK